MRSGVIAQKLGMTRIFTDAGEHVPVTVLKLDGCQVVAPSHQGEERLYRRCSSASARPRSRMSRKAERGHFAVAKVEPKRKLAEFRVSDDALIPVGAEITADHFVVGQFVDVTGTSIGKGFAGGMKRWNFGGLRATHGVSVSHRSIGSTGGRQDPGKTFKNKKMPGHMGVERVTTLNLHVVQTDIERGLILVEGAVPGSKGGWIIGARRGEEGAAEGRAEARQVPRMANGAAEKPAEAAPLRSRDEGGRVMKLKMSLARRQGSRARSTLNEEIFGLEPRADLIQRWCVWQLAKRRAGTHKVKSRAEIARTGKKLYKQKGTGGARHGSRRVPQFRGGGRAFGPVVRSHEIDLPKKVRALALKHALSAKAKDGGIVVLDKASSPSPRPRRCSERFAKLGSTNALIIDGAEVDTELRASPPATFRNIDVLPVQGINVYDILRREKLVLTKAAVDALEARFK